MVAGVVVRGVVFAVFDKDQWEAAALLRSPDGAAVVAGVGPAVVGVPVGRPTTVIADTLDGAGNTPLSLGTTGLVAVGFGAVVVTPVVAAVLHASGGRYRECEAGTIPRAARRSPDRSPV